MSLKHLGPGSKLPVLADNVLRLYSNVFCPFAQRARLVLVHKNIPYETVNINLREKPEWFAAINPSQLVPTLQLSEKKRLHESLVICEYLDAIYPQNKIIPSDHYEFGWHKLIIKYFTQPSRYFYKLAKGIDKTVGLALNEELVKFQANFDGRDFIGGNKPMYADFMIWPFIERLEYLHAHTEYKIDSERLEPLLKYIDQMKKVPAVRELLISVSDYEKFFKSYNDPELKVEYDHVV